MSRVAKLSIAAAPAESSPVTMLELFFDLVFVFAVTQLTSSVREAHGILDYVQFAALLCVVWWMYDGYCWLSNNVGPTTVSTRVPMLVAMAAFLVMAAAVPAAYGADRLVFAVAYLVVVVVHALSFARSSLGSSARAIVAIAPINLGATALLFVAAALPAHWRWVAWVAAVGLYVTSLVSQRESGFTLRADHFAERHRLLLIIAVGESIITIGVGAHGRLTEGRTLAAVLMALTLLSLFWWVHFAEDEVVTEALVDVARRDPSRITRVAMLGFSMAYLVLVAGLILVAAGLHSVIEEPTHALASRAAWHLGIGVAIFLAGTHAHRVVLGLPQSRSLGVAAIACLPTIWLGHATCGLVQVVVLCAVVATALALLKSHRR